MPAVGIEIKSVSRCFILGGVEVWALRDVTLNIAAQEFLALIGRSGSGKTTLLNLIAGLDRPTAGSICIDGEELGRYSDRQLTDLRRRQIGFVFQSFGLLPLLSALENVELAMRIGGAGRRDRIDRSRDVLDMMGLSKRMNHRPYELSGGEQQRVAIARAIANRPALVLADEPTGELDSATAISIFKLLRDIAQSEGITIVTSTHDRTVMELATRVVELADGRVRTGEGRDLLAYVAGRHGRLLVADGELPGDSTPSEPGESSTPQAPIEAEPEVPRTSTATATRTPCEQVWSPSQDGTERAGSEHGDAPVAPDLPAAWEPPARAMPESDEVSRWAPPERRS